MSWPIKKISGDDEVNKIIRDYLVSQFQEEFALYGDEETSMPVYFEKYMDELKNFEIRDDDVIVCTYPKTGTTWTQEMVWLIGNDLDYEGAKVNLPERFPFLEYCTIYNFDNSEKYVQRGPIDPRTTIERTKRMQSPRYIKIHLPFSLFPDQIKNGTKKPKIIYVVRNPKDACVSYYHHGKLLQYWRPNLEDFAKVFMTNRIMYGSLWKHYLGFWELRNSPNILIISYEDMKRDHPSVIKKVAAFLGKQLTEEQIEKLCQHLSFDSFKKNKAVNVEDWINLRRAKGLTHEEGTFVRSGTVGKYKEELSQDTIDKMNAWIRENTAGTGFDEAFHYDDA